jgi:hypothetical protein
MNFPPVFVINLDKRPDRWSDIQVEFKDWNIERVSATEFNPGWKGCTLSHIKCLELANQRNYDWILIVEDDCVLTPDTLNRFKNLLPTLWNRRSDWDVFVGGASLYRGVPWKTVSMNPRLYEVKSTGTHFTLLHKDSYKSILNRIPKNPSEMHNQGTDCIDTWYRFNNVRIWTTAPFLAFQKANFSNLSKTFADPTGVYKTSEFLLLHTESPKPTSKFIWSRFNWS